MKLLNIWMYCLVLCTSQASMAGDSLGFRGTHRNGLFSEKGLLKSWPKAGPQELWSLKGLGEAYASVAVSAGVTYTVGKKGLIGYLYAIDSKGQIKWSVAYGDEVEGGGFPGARSTPSIDEGLVYFTSGAGKVLAFDTAGKQIWQVDMLAKFGGNPPNFGISESILIEGNNLICTPGGPGASVVALNKKTGETVWQTKSLSDEASYCSPLIFDHAGRRQIITLTDRSLVGIDPKKGIVLWKQDYPAKYGIHTNTPVFDGNTIYVSDGHKQGGVAFELSADGKAVKELWREASLDVHHGGFVSLNGKVYGVSSKGVWSCLDLKSGKVIASFRDLGKGSIIYADGRLYGFDEKGRVGLVNPDPDHFSLVSMFEVSKGSGQFWSHPAISGGRLYIRHGDALMCFKIKAPEV